MSTAKIHVDKIQLDYETREIHLGQHKPWHNDECFVCGRGLTRETSGWYVHLVDGGNLIVPVDYQVTEEDEPGDCGWFPVGAGCVKKIPSGYKAKLEDT